MSVVLADIGPEAASTRDVISSSSDDETKEDTQPPASAPASIPDTTLPDATLRQSQRTNVKQGAEYRESNFDAQYDKCYGTQGTQHFQTKYKQ
eukprot:9358509-Ditylum_brightwellii.AAC.1